MVYYRYRKWTALLDLDLLLEKLRGHIRIKRGQNMEPSLGIMIVKVSNGVTMLEYSSVFLIQYRSLMPNRIIGIKIEGLK